MFIKITWYNGESSNECVVSTVDAAFDVCWALDKSVRQWKLDVPLESIIWYNENVGWENLVHKYKDWDFS